MIASQPITPPEPITKDIRVGKRAPEPITPPEPITKDIRVSHERDTA